MDDKFKKVLPWAVAVVLAIWLAYLQGGVWTLERNVTKLASFIDPMQVMERNYSIISASKEVEGEIVEISDTGFKMVSQVADLQRVKELGGLQGINVPGISKMFTVITGDNTKYNPGKKELYIGDRVRVTAREYVYQYDTLNAEEVYFYTPLLPLPPEPAMTTPLPVPVPASLPATPAQP